ncbi:hemolysin III family protein [Oscillochloris sp. ZM17-4]|uniref:PAQR family membrane homeostasis protein TrhA n=1 Tax=Oscillochloris sp. ZM17-4 TaxID=2866714 RepID=UPI001C732219|nr:hemolysin III family protein [Oscillochloris sp. ZM17-4]MBX0326985.1 hemolysin III family protein [Oscillochloris sp. ZM17-4]
MQTTGNASRFSLGEIIANAVTHGIGAALSIAGLAVLVAFASLNGDAWQIVSVSIYGATLIFLYLFSTLYHSIQGPRVSQALRVFDHSAIFLLIAGTYTPFTLVTLRGTLGWTLFGIVWGLALFGVAFQTTLLRRHVAISLALYIGMGWAVVIAARPLLDALSLPGVILLAAGGLAYTLGVIFYVWRRLPYHHAIWHLFVLAGSTLHFFAILLYVI